MINSIGNQGFPQPGPQGVPDRGASNQARGDERTGGLKRGDDKGRGFMRGHVHMHGRGHRAERNGLTETERELLKLAHKASVRYLHDQMEKDGPTKVDRARISTEGLDRLQADDQAAGGAGGGGAVSGGPRGDQPVGGPGGPADDQPVGGPGGPADDQPVGGGDGGAVGGGAVSDQVAPPKDDGPSGPTYTARRA